MHDAKKFIEDLKLSDPKHRSNFPDYSMYEAASETPSFLNFKGLSSFSPSVTKQTQEDVLNSMLLAQRAATKAFPGDMQVYDWYKMYFDILQRLGWLINQKDFNTVEQKSNSFELEKAIFSLLADLVTGQQIKILMRSIELLKSLGDDDQRLVAFERNTHSHGRGNFQLGMAEAVNGTVSILGSGFILEADKKITRILFSKFDEKTIRMNFCFFRAEMVVSEYAKNRNHVKEKLGDSEQFIASLDL